MEYQHDESLLLNYKFLASNLTSIPIIHKILRYCTINTLLSLLLSLISITSFTFPPFFAVSIFMIWCKSARTRTVLSPIISFFALIGVSFRFSFCAPKFPTITHFFLFLLILILSSTITNHL
ncbi:hypothetical protein RR47_GL001730 [Enterococcus columbae DSM 7374 = ATCC 51263]|nr:hypothetical protein RR47_GL001730 [Enterococcus columbae DSM 7374 = ATCC 51263]